MWISFSFNRKYDYSGIPTAANHMIIALEKAKAIDYQIHAIPGLQNALDVEA